MSVPEDELRVSVARIVRGTAWSVLTLFGLGVALHMAGVFTFPPLAALTAVALIGVTFWYARLVEHSEQSVARLVAFHVVFIVGITVINHALGGIRFPAGMLFYALLVVSSGFSAPVRYVLANLSATAYALLVGLEQAGIVPRAASAFSPSAVPVPPWQAQLTLVATFTVSLNLLAVVTQRLMGLLELSRQGLADTNRELEGWRERLAEQVRTRTQELEVANRELDARARALEERGRRLRDFIYTVTHDLKTPVNSILLISDLLLERDAARLSADGQRDLERIAHLASRTEHMIGDLFALFQITSAHEPREEVESSDVARRALDDLAPQVAAKGITVRVDPLPRVWAAPRKLQHVLTNLLANAVKHVPTNTGLISITGARNGVWTRLSVCDNGPGIAPEYHESIFELFGRVLTTDQAAGTGVGLAIVRALVDGHGGRVWVESTPGAGATFHVELPVSTDAGTPDA